MAEPQLMRSSADWELEQQEWIEALAGVLHERGGDDAKALLARLQHELSQKGIVLTDAALNTPYKNTIGLADQPPYPGDIELESRIEDILRQQATAMVLQDLTTAVPANRLEFDQHHQCCHREEYQRDAHRLGGRLYGSCLCRKLLCEFLNQLFFVDTEKIGKRIGTAEQG